MKIDFEVPRQMFVNGQRNLFIENQDHFVYSLFGKQGIAWEDMWQWTATYFDFARSEVQIHVKHTDDQRDLTFTLKKYGRKPNQTAVTTTYFDGTVWRKANTLSEALKYAKPPKDAPTLEHIVTYPGSNPQQSLHNAWACRELRHSTKTLYSCLYSHIENGTATLFDYADIAYDLHMEERELRQELEILQALDLLSIRQEKAGAVTRRIHILSEVPPNTKEEINNVRDH